MPDGAPTHPPPPWLSSATLAAARAAGRPPEAFAGRGGVDSRALREAVLAHHPALPLTMIAEAVAYLLGEE
jgi:hypothetical protein